MVATSLKQAVQSRANGPLRTKSFQYLSRSWSCLVHNPKLFLMRKLARLEILRKIMGWVSTHTTPTSQSIKNHSASTLDHLDLSRIQVNLREQGVHAGLQLPKTVVKTLVAFAHHHPFAADRDPSLLCHFDDRRKVEAHVGHAFQMGNFRSQDCPLIQDLIHDPGLLAIATTYLGTQPTNIGSELLWSFPTEANWTQQIKAAQVFHYDVDDYRSVKFFFYLTDVDEHSGPHVSIQGTHWGKKLIHQVMGQRCAGLPDQALVDLYGEHRVVTHCGEAGFGIVEDTFCFHKGTRPITKPRLMLQIQYAINDYGEIRSYL